MLFNSSGVDVEDVEAAVVLSADWSRVGRLLLVTAMTVFGSIGNVFMISAVFIDDRLRIRGNAFVVNMALADLVITGAVMPGSVIALLAARPDTTQTVCSVQWILALLSCLVSILSMAATAMENLARLVSPKCYTNCFSPCYVTFAVLSLWLAAVVVVALQASLRLGPDYCQRTDHGLEPFQVAIGVCLVAIPVTITVTCYTTLCCRLRAARAVPAYRTAHSALRDHCQLVGSNAIAFLIFVVFWLPFGATLVIGPRKSVSRRTFYTLAWIALAKSCVQNLVYCITNRHFRSAYVDLFHYCCCKTTVPLAGRRARESAGTGGIRSPGDVRVHIIPAYNINYASPARGRSDRSACDL